MASRFTPTELIRSALQLADQQPIRGARFAQLLRQVDPNFTQSQYGATTLRAFLERYPDVVSIQKLGADGDMLLSIPAGGRPERAGTQQMRRDLWAAFTLVNQDLRRFYDRKHDGFVTFPVAAKNGEIASIRTARLAVQNDPSNFVEVSPVTSDEQLTQARAFVASLPYGDDKQALESALNSHVWFREFVTALRARGALHSRWRAERTEFVLSKVRAWARENGLNIPSVFYRAEQRSEVPLREASSVVSQETKPQPETQRERILAALSRMPTSLLLAIPIPGEYWLASDE